MCPQHCSRNCLRSEAVPASPSSVSDGGRIVSPVCWSQRLKVLRVLPSFTQPMKYREQGQLGVPSALLCTPFFCQAWLGVTDVLQPLDAAQPLAELGCILAHKNGFLLTKFTTSVVWKWILKKVLSYTTYCLPSSYYL